MFGQELSSIHSEIPDIKKIPDKRLCELLTVRILVKQVFGDNSRLSYTSDGAPYIDGFSGHISVSHTKSCVALAVHPTEIIGLDVEQKNNKILALQKKFMNETETESLHSENPLTGTTLIWSAKESLFKAMRTTDVDFRSQLHVVPVDTRNSSGITDACETHSPAPVRYKIYYRIFDEFILTTAIKNNNI